MQRHAFKSPDRPSLVTRIRQHFSSGHTSRAEFLLGVAFLAAAAALAWFSDRLPLAASAVLAVTLLLALSAAASVGWLPLLGPVFVAEFVRASRRGRHAALRVAYAVGLFLFLLALHRNYTELTGLAYLGAGGMARFAETFCYTFLSAQFLAVAALTPAYVAGAVAEEKDRKTLEFLLATEVRNREIVFGKLAARLLSLGLLVLTGLPILSLTQLWGGVDLGVLAAFFAATGLTALSLAGLSLLASVHARNAREAIVLAYLAIAGYLGLTAVLQLVVSVPTTADYALTGGLEPLTVQDLVEPITAGNPALAVLNLRQDLVTGTSLQAALTARFKSYALVHGLIIVVCLGWSVLRVRALALGDMHVKQTPKARVKERRWRPRPGRRPLVWKEVFAERGLSFNWFGKAIVVLIVLVSFLPAAWLGGRFLFDLFRLRGESLGEIGSLLWWTKISEEFNLWVRVVGTLVACLTLLGVAVRAASAVGGERDRQTLDSLLTVPRDAGAFLGAKWLGSVLSVRRAWAWLALVWVLGIMTGGLYPATVPWIMLAWFVYAGFLAALGLWFSIVCRTTLRATVWTLIAAAGLGGGHWYLWIVLCLPLGLRGDVFEAWLNFEKYALTPPLALAWFSFRGNDVRSLFGADHDDPLRILGHVLTGLVVWGGAGLVVWTSALRRFRVLSNRAAFVPAPPDTELPRPRRSRRRRVVVAGIAVLVLGLTAGYAYFALTADRHLREALAETDRLDPHWRLPDIEARRTLVPADKNAVPMVTAARAAMGGWGWPHHWDELRIDELRPEQRLTREQVALMTDDLEEVEDALPDVDKLLDLPAGHRPTTYARGFVMTLLPYVDQSSGVHSLLRFQMMLRVEAGDSDGAMADCRRLGNLARSLGDEPFLITQNLRLHWTRDAARGVERVLAQGEPSGAELAAAQRWLEEEEPHPGLLIGARGERAGMDGFLELIQSGELSMKYYRQFLRGPNESGGPTALEWVRFSLTPGAEKENRASLLDYNNRLVAAAALPVEEQATAFARLAEERKALPALAQELALGDQFRFPDRYRAGKAELRCAIAALAAERFRHARGRWPESLDELVPDYLAKVPLDPFTAAPLRFRRLDDGLVIYSVGPDGSDDGGDIDERLDVGKGKDVGFRLWDVVRRQRVRP